MSYLKPDSSDEKARIEKELAERCYVFYEVYEEDLKMIQEYLDRVDELCEAQFQTAYSHWRNLLKDMRQGVQLLRENTPLNDTENFQDSLRAFSFTSTVRFLRDIAKICDLKLERQWVERFQAHVLLIMQTHQEMIYAQNSASDL